MEREELWMRFEKSGRIADYLSYVHAKTEVKADANQNSGCHFKTT